MMTDEALAVEIASLKDAYGEVSTAKTSAGQTLVRIGEASLPRGCSPATTPVLLVVPPGQVRPQIYVKRGIRLRSGVEPRSTSSVSVEGEEWLQFSYSFPWNENSNTLVQLVATALRRFAESS